MKKQKITVVIFIILVLIFPAGLAAMGHGENSNIYKSELQMVFDESIEGLYNGEMEPRELKNRFEELRNKYDISYTDKAGILDAIIDRAAEQTFTSEEAQFYVELLQEGLLMKYRRDAYRHKSDQHQKEVISLLQQQLELNELHKTGADKLLSILNNYYDFIGLEYNEEYFNLSNMIISMKEERITGDEMTAALDSMKKDLIRKINLEQSRNEERTASQSGNHTDDGQSFSNSGPQKNDSSSSNPAAGFSGSSGSGGTSSQPVNNGANTKK